MNRVIPQLLQPPIDASGVGGGLCTAPFCPPAPSSLDLGAPGTWLKHPISPGCGCGHWGAQAETWGARGPSLGLPITPSAPTTHPMGFPSSRLFSPPPPPPHSRLFISFRHIWQRCHGNAAAAPAGCACLDAEPQEPSGNLVRGLDTAPRGGLHPWVRGHPSHPTSRTPQETPPPI